jgi:hypothetical protein
MPMRYTKIFEGTDPIAELINEYTCEESRQNLFISESGFAAGEDVIEVFGLIVSCVHLKTED